MSALSAIKQSSSMRQTQGSETKRWVRRRKFVLPTNAGGIHLTEVLPPGGERTRAVLFVHGMTFPSKVDFDLQVPGYSLAEYMASKGICCYLLDLRGYGESCKPDDKEPIGDEQWAEDLGAAFLHVQRYHLACDITLFGLSHGCTVIAQFLKGCAEKTAGSIFVAPCYLQNRAIRSLSVRARLFRLGLALTGRSKRVYATLGKKLIKKRLFSGEESLIDKTVFTQFVDEAIKLQSPDSGGLRAPLLVQSGVRGNTQKLGEPLFDPSYVRAPLLILRGATDDICCENSASSLARDAETSHVEIVEFKKMKHDLHLYQGRQEYFDKVHEFVSR